MTKISKFALATALITLFAVGCTKKDAPTDKPAEPAPAVNGAEGTVVADGTVAGEGTIPQTEVPKLEDFICNPLVLKIETVEPNVDVYFRALWPDELVLSKILLPENAKSAIDCDGDGTYDTAEYKCHFAEAGEHKVSIKGENISLQLCADNCVRTDDGYSCDNHLPYAVKSIESWGSVKWSSMAYFAAGCQNMVLNAKDVPDLSAVESMSYMFAYNGLMDTNIENWDVSHVTDMNGLFLDAYAFNHPLDKWDVSKVTEMHDMFYGAAAFNQPLASWNVSNVTNMAGMFEGATAFNQDISGWNVSNVTLMDDMFYSASVFNQDISGWDVSNVEDMSGMFEKATAFNQPIGKWNVAKVTKMTDMFRGATSFNQPLEDWNVSNVTDMAGMFDHALAFNQPLGKWDVSKVEYFQEMFKKATAYNQSLKDWKADSAINNIGFSEDAEAFVADNLPVWPERHKSEADGETAPAEAAASGEAAAAE